MPDPKELPPEELLALASGSAPALERARMWFRAQGAAGVPLLLRGLEDDRLGRLAHQQILRLLGELQREETIPAIRAALHRALDRDDPIVRAGAMDGLACFAAPEAVDELIQLLAHPNLDIVRRAAVLAGHARSPRALEPLRGLFGHADASIRYAAVQGLIALNLPNAWAALREQLAHEQDGQVRTLIRSALAK